MAINSSVGFSAPIELKGILFHEDGLTFQVAQGASCSGNHKALYTVEVEEAYPLRITLSQTKREPCEKTWPNGVLITYSYKELGLRVGDRFVISNEVTLSPIEVYHH